MRETPQVPEQEKGAQSNTESSREFRDEAAAMEFYEVLKQRLAHPATWHRHAGWATAEFELMDSKGTRLERAVARGDYFRIDIPGPGPAAGEGYDWVQVEAIEETAGEEGACFVIRVRPAPSPLNEARAVAHFFSDEATSSFVAKREGLTVTAAVYGRNEKPNTDTDTVGDKARNLAVAGGAISGFSKMQWKSLVTGLVKD